MQKIIGTTTRYHGTGLPFLRRYPVVIRSVIRGGEHPDFDPECDADHLYTDEEIAAVGGVSADDTIIVQPWLEKYGRCSFASSDAAATDLECFAHLRADAGTKADPEPAPPARSTLTRKRKQGVSAPKTTRRGAHTGPAIRPVERNRTTRLALGLYHFPIFELQRRIFELSGKWLDTNNRRILSRKLAELLDAPVLAAARRSPQPTTPTHPKQGDPIMATTTTTPAAAELQKLPIKELKARITELSGQKLKSNNRPFLAKKLAGLLADKAAEEARQAKAEAKAPKAKRRAASKRGERDPRLPAAGTVLTREYKGDTIQVEILDDGFRYNGATYPSLSTVARVATGTIWNGFAFFGLAARPKRSKDQAAA